MSAHRSAAVRLPSHKQPTTRHNRNYTCVRRIDKGTASWIRKSEPARTRFAEAVNRAKFAGKRTLIRRHGKDVAAVVSVEDLKTLEALEDRLDLEDARRIMKKPGRLIAWKRIKEDLGL